MDEPTHHGLAPAGVLPAACVLPPGVEARRGPPGVERRCVSTCDGLGRLGRTCDLGFRLGVRIPDARGQKFCFIRGLGAALCVAA